MMMIQTREPDRYSIRAIDRAFRILDCFSLNQNELTLGELVERSGLPKTTVFRILQSVERHRGIAFNPVTNRYALGIKFFELGGIVFSTLKFRGVAAPFLDRLALKGERTVLAAMLEGGELLYIDHREMTASLRITSQIGKRKPPHYGMLGKTLMAYLPDEEVDELLKRYPLKKIAPRTVVLPKTFKKHLKEIRTKGYTYEDNEAAMGMVGIAAPVRNHLGEVIAAVGITFPSFKIEDRTITEAIATVKETTAEISLALGYPKSREGKSEGSHLIE
jgi:IclR family transcriptional regulator, KDG regulon repressor